jgi:threonine synthase
LTDTEILSAQSWLAKAKVFRRTASAASVAGLFKLGKTGARRIAYRNGSRTQDPDTAMTAGDYKPRGGSRRHRIRRVLENRHR